MPPYEPKQLDAPDRQRFEMLITKVWNGELDEYGAVELGRLLSCYAELRPSYLEAKLSLANLVDLCKRSQDGAASRQEFQGESATTLDLQLGSARSALTIPRSRVTHPVHGRWMGGLAAVAAALLVGVILWSRKTDDGSPAATAHPSSTPTSVVVATVVDAVSTDIVDIPVFSGRQLAAGQVVELESGMAELRFLCGANIVLAGPARLTIQGPKKVMLDVGRITVRMDDGVDGFQVITPDGQVTDLGTAFAVSFANGSNSQVAVFEGEVELKSKQNVSESKRLLAGEAARFGGVDLPTRVLHPAGLAGLKNVSLRRPDGVVAAFKDAYVRGKDFLKRYESENYGDADELLVKYETAATQSNRRAWIGFDLSAFPREQLIGARLILTVLPNRLAEEYQHSKNKEYSQSDTTWDFEVAGLWDQFYDEWTEDEITWLNAPGNSPNHFSGLLSGPQAPVSLGTFSIHASGKRGDQVVVAGSRLLDFLREDEDGRVTLIVSRRTPCFYDSGEDVVVHGFASREHGELAPPTLELWGEIERNEVERARVKDSRANTD